MSTPPSTADSFEATYARSDDPWSFASDAYELGRYRTILEFIDPGRHRRVFEPGCSIGVLTEMLGHRCAEVDATDVSPTAVARARARCVHLPGVTIRVGGLTPPRPIPYDLVVFSEVGYYLDGDALDATARDLSAALDQRGRLVAAHWIGRSSDHVLHGFDVHDHLRSALADWRHLHSVVHRDPDRDGFVLDIWDRR